MAGAAEAGGLEGAPGRCHSRGNSGGRQGGDWGLEVGQPLCDRWQTIADPWETIAWGGDRGPQGNLGCSYPSHSPWDLPKTSQAPTTPYCVRVAGKVLPTQTEVGAGGVQGLLWRPVALITNTTQSDPLSTCVLVLYLLRVHPRAHSWAWEGEKSSDFFVHKELVIGSGEGGQCRQNTRKGTRGLMMSVGKEVLWEETERAG